MLINDTVFPAPSGPRLPDVTFNIILASGAADKGSGCSHRRSFYFPTSVESYFYRVPGRCTAVSFGWFPYSPLESNNETKSHFESVPLKEVV